MFIVAKARFIRISDDHPISASTKGSDSREELNPVILIHFFLSVSYNSLRRILL